MVIWTILRDQINMKRKSLATVKKYLIVQTEGTAELAKEHAECEFEKYRIVQDRLYESDFDRAVKQLEEKAREIEDHGKARKDTE